MGKGSRRLRQDRNASGHQAVKKVTVWHSYIQEIHAEAPQIAIKTARLWGIFRLG